MKRKVFTDGNGSKHIFVEGLGEFSPKQDHDSLVEEVERLRGENQRLTSIATKHATRADELYEALENIVNSAYEDTAGDGWQYNATIINNSELELAKKVLDKSRIDADEE